MSNNQSRRRVLRAASVGVGGVLAGCLGSNLLGCADHHAVVIQTEPVTTTPENPLQISELPADQKPFLQKAVKNGEFRECPTTKVENGEALNDLAVAAREHRNPSENDTVYLERQGEYYAINRFQIADESFV